MSKRVSALPRLPSDACRCGHARADHHTGGCTRCRRFDCPAFRRADGVQAAANPAERGAELVEHPVERPLRARGLSPLRLADLLSSPRRRP